MFRERQPYSEAYIMKVGVAGQGAFGIKHLEAIQKIPGIEVITLTGGNQAATAEVAAVAAQWIASTFLGLLVLRKADTPRIAPAEVVAMLEHALFSG
jgi:hypothetical protein